MPGEKSPYKEKGLKAHSFVFGQPRKKKKRPKGKDRLCPPGWWKTPQELKGV